MNKQILSFSVIAIALVFAVILGSNVATENYETLSIYAVTAIVIYFLIHGWKNVWWFTALLVFSGVVFQQGFVFDANHLFIAMLVIASTLSFLNKNTAPQSEIMRQAGSNWLVGVLAILLFYGGIHFAVNYAIPHSPRDYSLKSCLKAYFEAYASIFASLWLLASPYSFKMKDSWSLRFLGILVFAVVANTFIRGLLYVQGFQAADGLSGQGFMGVQQYFFSVPVINMQAGIYTLRDLSPIAAVVLAMFVSSPIWWRQQHSFVKGIILIGLLTTLVGATFSGGRVTLIFSVGLLGMVAIVRKKIGLVFISAALAVLLFGIVNIFSTKINRDAPTYIARSLQFLMIDKGSTYSGISGSQDTRNAAFEQALIEWRKDNRTLVFGRSVYEISGQEAFIIGQTMGLDGFVLNAMKSGRTHNLITDLLLQYGIIGFFLYTIAYVSMIFYFLKLYRRIPWEEDAIRSLVGAVAIYLPFIYVYQMIGGNFMPTVVPLVLGVTRAILIKNERESEELQRVEN